MNEKSALSLSRFAGKEKCLESLSRGNQLFPIMSAVKVVRDIKSSKDSGDASQLADDRPAKQRVGLVVVHAADQPLSEAPSKAALEMIPMIRDLRDDDASAIDAGRQSNLLPLV